MNDAPRSVLNAFAMFSRNQRWGTCVDCPRDVSGMAYPEFCMSSDRYDHQLGVDELTRAYKAYAR